MAKDEATDTESMYASVLSVHAHVETYIQARVLRQTLESVILFEARRGILERSEAAAKTLIARLTYGQT